MPSAGLYLLPVPSIFWSVYLDGPFESCVDCQSRLEDASNYLIQKRMVADEAVFEMAICDRCRQCLTDAYSEETKLALSSRMAEYFQNQASRIAVPGQPPLAAEDLLDRCLNFCLMCGMDRRQCHRYSLAGLFIGDEIVVQSSPLGQSPVMICEDCESTLAPLISRQTRDQWDRFMREKIDGPPGVGLDVPYEQPLPF